MNRLAKFSRAASGVFLLANLVVFFLPVLVIKQENYPEMEYSSFSYVKGLFGYGNTGMGKELTTEGILIIIFLIILPLVLSLIMGVIGIVGSPRQVFSCIGAVFTVCINILFLLNHGLLAPERLNAAQQYERGMGFWMLAAFSAISVIFAVAGLISTPRIKKDVKIQDGEQAEVQQAAAGQEGNSVTSIAPTGIVQDTAKDITEIPDALPNGVMFGLSGDYQGAQIPFGAGETLKLGRDTSNDLVFSGKKRVSRFHCSITWLPDKKKYQIVDQSSNGSFIEGREDCLPQNIAVFLEPGTILYIGSQENSFKLY